MIAFSESNGLDGLSKNICSNYGNIGAIYLTRDQSYKVCFLFGTLCRPANIVQYCSVVGMCVCILYACVCLCIFLCAM